MRTLVTRDRTRSAATRSVLAVQYLVLTVLALVALLHQFVSIDPHLELDILSWAVLALTLWTVYSWRWVLERDLFQPYMMFFVSAVVVSAGPVLLDLTGLTDQGLLGGHFPIPVVVDATFFVLLCLATLHFGALLAWGTDAGRTAPNPPEAQRRVAKDMRAVGWVLLGISIVPAAYVVGQAVRITSSRGYVGYYEAMAPHGVMAAPEVLTGFLVPALLILVGGSLQARRTRWTASLLLLLYALAELYIGRRTDSLIPLIALLWVWHRAVSRLPEKPVVAAVALMLFVVSPAVGYARHYTDKLNGVVQYVSDVGERDNPMVNAFAEYGGSMEVVCYVLELVPSERPYDLGMNYLYSALLVVPNFLKGFALDPQYGNPAIWLTQRVRPDMRRVGGGLGFNLFAEAFCAYGWFGAPLVILVFGLALGRFNGWATRGDGPLRAVIVGICLVALLHATRGTVAEVVRPVVWYAVAPYLLVRFVGWLRGPTGSGHQRARSRMVWSSDEGNR